MRILVDARCLTKQLDGVANYLINAICAIAEICDDIEIYLLAHKAMNEKAEYRLKDYSNIHRISGELKLFPNNGFLWFLMKLPFLVRKFKPDIFWAPAVVVPLFIPRKIKLLITVHDMVYQYYRNTMSIKNKISNLYFHNKSIRTADYIWAVSHYTKCEIERYYTKRRCDNIFVGSSINLKLYKKLEIGILEKEELCHTLCIPEKFLLFVGTVEPRKNLTFLLKLVPYLVEDGLGIVIVGAKGWGDHEDIKKILDQPGYPKDLVKFTGYISDNDLVKLYNIASCFVSTSLNEGFGLPQLEAMACGCPVITANNSAMSEVVDGAGFLVDGWDIDVWVEVIRKALISKDILQSNYQKKLEIYDWKNIVIAFKNYILD